MRLEYFDVNGVRAEAWRGVGLTASRGLCRIAGNSEVDNEGIEPEPSFILIHTRDIKSAVSNLGIAGFETRIRRLYGDKTALLYISGYEHPAQHFDELPASMRQISSHPWSYWHSGRVLPEKKIAFLLFLDRLWNVIDAWKSAGGAEPPRWDLLRACWLSEISEAAAVLLLHPSKEGREEASCRIRKLLQKADVDREIDRLRSDGLTEQVRRACTLLVKLRDRSILDTATQPLLSRTVGLLEGLSPAQVNQLSSVDFDSMRQKLRHDHFLNGLINVIGPGWNESERLSSDDMVLKALSGDERAGELLRAVISNWREKSSLVVRELIDMSGRVVPRIISEDDCLKALQADSVICGVFELGEQDPRARSEAFWSACERLGQVLAARSASDLMQIPQGDAD